MNQSPLFAAAAVLALAIVTAGCKVYENKGTEPNKGSDLTPICHRGNTTIRVDDAAVRAHLNHGDSLGECR